MDVMFFSHDSIPAKHALRLWWLLVVAPVDVLFTLPLLIGPALLLLIV